MVKVMKKIYVLAAAVLFSTAVFAGGAPDKPASATGVAVMKQGESVFKVIYKGAQATNVKVSIYDAGNKLVLSETIKRMDGFMRPYEFEGMNEGEYTVVVADQDGERTEKISYGDAGMKRLVNVVKISGDDRFLLTVAGKGEGKVNINIFDGDDALVHHETRAFSKSFGQVYRLKNVKRDVTFEISDEHGSKRIKY